MDDNELANDGNNQLKEIEKIVYKALEDNAEKLQEKVFKKVIDFLAKRAVFFFITIISGLIMIFTSLTYFISTTKENIELKGKVERLQLQLEELKTKNIKVNNSKTK